MDEIPFEQTLPPVLPTHGLATFRMLPSRFIDLLNLLNFFIELVLNFTSQFFQNILKGYHTSVLKLVYHDGEVQFAIEEKFEKFFESAGFGTDYLRATEIRSDTFLARFRSR